MAHRSPADAANVATPFLLSYGKTSLLSAPMVSEKQFTIDATLEASFRRIFESYSIRNAGNKPIIRKNKNFY
jgi:hypothetical protein